MTAIELPVEIGTELPTLVVRLTRETLVRYAGAAGDFNPIHYSDFHARALGLPGVIGHGMLTMGLALRAVTDWAGDPVRVRGAFVRFTRPIQVPDDEAGAELVVTGKVTKINDGVATIQLDARHGDDKVLGMATAEVDVS
ncbi:MaoC/PaaZ C-terminal domain-containing protein [Microlunatus sp. Gsoil 973]|jgi:acyl dehydratase|uniref:MaoC/PaaZ C-terminal domain-containing protein n=1 Tax=Microlunatus sp. Gsoil 973 TaxID=2672569 RepID=UPI0012B44BA6|nr:MaoC/PaaZ C-terminal domain-containing protein [Microlunatus sp. Gsoil 973]QGN35006.1 dehydratase [Microlunatus sp. Gsoil 973]